MTEASSCKKSFFGNYLRYRFGELKGIIFMSAVMNLVTLPFVGFAIYLIADRMYKLSVLHSGAGWNIDTINYVIVCAMIAIVAMIVTVMIGALTSYNFYNRKECVDTLGVLALSYKQRFFGDFLSGLISTMGAFIPGAAIGIGFSLNAQNKLNQVTAAAGEESINIMSAVWGLVITLFFTYLFTYLLTTLAATCCGKISSTMVFSVVSMIAVSLLVISTAKFASLSAVGTDAGIVNKVAEFCQPGGLFFGNTFKLLADVITSKDVFEDLPELNSALASPISTIIMLIIAAALVFLAYILGKARKQERVGSMFVHTGYLYALTIITAAGGFMLAACLLRNTVRRGWMIPVGFIVSFAVAAVFEIIRRPRLRQLPKSALRWAVTSVCCAGLVALLDTTGTFGAINLPSDVQSISVEFMDGNSRCEIEFTEPEEIDSIINAHNETVNSYSKFFTTPNSQSLYTFNISCTTKSGKTISRSYTENFYSWSWGNGYYSFLTYLSKDIISMPSYPEKFSEPLTGNLESGGAIIQGIYNEVAIPYELLPQFAQTLREDIINNYSTDGTEIGTASFITAESNGNIKYFPILKDYTNTINMIRALNEDAEVDPNAKVMSVLLDVFEKVYNSYYSYHSSVLSLNITIFQKDLENEKVKELMDLMEVAEDYKPKHDEDRYISLSFISMDGIDYYIPESKINDAAKLVIEIARESYTDESPDAVE